MQMKNFLLLDRAMLWLARISIVNFLVTGALLTWQSFAPRPDDSSTMTLHWDGLSEGLLDLATAFLWTACIWALPHIFARILLGLSAALQFFSASSAFAFIYTNPDESNPLWATVNTGFILFGSVAVVWLTVRGRQLAFVQPHS